MSRVFTDADLDKLAAPHVARCWFLELDLPSGIARLHSGVGRVQIGGQEWRGVGDPLGTAVISISGVEEPAFGQAAAVTVVLSGANAGFVKSVHATAREIEGREANLYWAMFDQETGENLIGLTALFPNGRMTAPAIRWQGIGIRTVSLTIESIWSSQNFAPGGKWNGSAQRQRYPGDLGLDFVGVEVNEAWQ